MNTVGNPNVDAFQADVMSNGGYAYTTNARLSARLANGRLTDVTVRLADLRGKTVLDVGCGDGAYTVELWDRGRPAELTGLEPVESAVILARRRAGGRPVRFDCGSAYDLPYPAGRFDLAVIRGVLHHLDRPADAVREALRVAAAVLVIEPNGYNPVLKVLEKTSRYHIEHDEKSYPPHRLNAWVRAAGGTVVARKWVGLVPFFAPDWMARVLKAVEPLAERVPVARAVGCGQYVFLARSGAAAPAAAKAAA